MTVTTVNGTPLQAAIDAASPGDTLSVKAGTYAGGIKHTNKPISIRSDGGAILDAGDTDGKVNVDIASRDVIHEGLTYMRGGCSVRFKGDCTGSVIRQFESTDVRRMVSNTGSGDNGGNHFQWVSSIGGEVADGRTFRGRAPSRQYGFDGGSFEVFGGARGGRIRRVETFDDVVVSESGKNAGQSDNTDFVFEDCIFHGRRLPLVPASSVSWPFNAAKQYRMVANGVYMRAIGVQFTRCTFDKLDDWCIVAETGGNFGGGLGLAFDDCTFDLQYRLITVLPNVPLSAIAIRNATLIHNNSAVVAEIAGKGTTKDRATLESWTGWTFRSWSAGPPPVADPCAEEMALVVDLTHQRDALQGKVDAALVALQ